MRGGGKARKWRDAVERSAGRVQSSGVRLLPWVLGASVAVAGCGLDADGLDPTEGGATSSDAMSSEDTSSAADGTATDSTLSDSAPKASDSGVRADADASGGSDGSPNDGAANDGAGSDDAEEASASDGGEDSAPDARSDSAPSDAATPDASDACGPVEICNNGIDDNCNGLVDCADPACSPAWSCTAASIPAGWSIVEYVENARPTCATAYGTSLDVVEGPSGAPATCGCTCGITTPGSCEIGSFTVYVGGAIGGCALIPAATSPGNGGACSPAMPSFAAPDGTKFQIDPIGYTTGSCTPDPTITVPDAGFVGQGRLCVDTAGSGAGCTNGGVCAPAVQGGGFSLCISHGGTETCPAGYTTAHTVGTTITDTRSCSACTCGGATATCGPASVTFFADGGCDDDGATVAADSVCNDFPGAMAGGPTYVAYEYTAGVQGEGCQASPGSPDGGVSLTSPHTVCCQ